ncbi:hypothetical protein V5O48_010526 [Marasmius crinis-equi]|uniref:Uncharacterized protein n=1 Tax=Marasmius crinis-equi TaxID=585013 RepID=A0ABR3F8Q7_9AGAR
MARIWATSMPRTTSETGMNLALLIVGDLHSIVAVPAAGPQNPVSPLCDALAANGGQACPDESTGDYRYRTTPATPSCPARGSRRRSILGLRAGLEESKHEIKVRTIYTDANQTLLVYGHGAGPKVGGKVWTPTSDEGGFHSTIVKIDE